MLKNMKSEIFVALNLERKGYQSSILYITNNSVSHNKYLGLSVCCNEKKEVHIQQIASAMKTEYFN